MWSLISKLFLNKWALGGLLAVGAMEYSGIGKDFLNSTAEKGLDGLKGLDWGGIGKNVMSFFGSNPGVAAGGALGMLFGKSMLSTAIGVGLGFAAQEYYKGSFNGAAAPGAPAPAPQLTSTVDSPEAEPT